MKNFLTFSLYLTFLLLTNVVLREDALGQSVTISGENPRQEITVNTEDASIIDIIQSLAKKFNFRVTDENSVFPTTEITTTFKGSLEDILTRLLKNSNHLIVRSSTTVSGIERIVILRSSESEDEDDENTPATGLPPRFTKSPEQ